jgi:hypothetical protein
MSKKSFSPIKKIIISAVLLLIIIMCYTFIYKFLGADIAFISSALCFFCAQYLIIYSVYDFIKWPQKKWIKLLLAFFSYSFYITFLRSFLFPLFRETFCKDCTYYQLVAADFLSIKLITFLVFLYVLFTVGAIIYDLGRYLVSKIRNHKTYY